VPAAKYIALTTGTRIVDARTQNRQFITFLPLFYSHGAAKHVRQAPQLAAENSKSKLKIG